MTISVFESGRQTFVQHSIRRLVAGQRLFGQVLVRLCQTFHFSEACVESHGWVTGVLGHVQVSCPPQLLLNHQSLLQQLQREKEVERKDGDRQREIHFGPDPQKDCAAFATAKPVQMREKITSSSQSTRKG